MAPWLAGWGVGERLLPAPFCTVTTIYAAAAAFFALAVSETHTLAYNAENTRTKLPPATLAKLDHHDAQ